MRNDSSRDSDEAGHDAQGSGLRVRPSAHLVAAQAVGPDAAHETGVVTKPPEGRGSAGLTERLAMTKDLVRGGCAVSPHGPRSPAGC